MGEKMRNIFRIVNLEDFLAVYIFERRLFARVKSVGSYGIIFLLFCVKFHNLRRKGPLFFEREGREKKITIFNYRISFRLI